MSLASFCILLFVITMCRRSEPPLWVPLSYLFIAFILIIFASDLRADFNQDFEKFKSNARHWAPIHCQTLDSPNWDERVSSVYYDAGLVYDYVGRLTGESSLNSCRDKAINIYLNDFIAGNYLGIPGYWNFTDGLTHLQKTSEVFNISTQAAYARHEANGENINDPALSREVSYALVSYINAEHFGYPDNALRGSRVAASYAHFDSWFNTHTAPYVRPFMVALSAKGLIRNNELHPDARTLPTIKQAADWMWQNMWVSASWAFRYTDRNVPSGGTEPSPDLNLLIAPVYAWLYAQTGEVGYRDKFDAIFFGGVNYAFLGNAKQFNQNYWNMEEAITNRNSGSPTPLPTPTPTATRTATPIPTNTPTPGITPTRTPTAIPTQVACPDCPPRCPEKVKNRANGKVMNFVGEASLCQYR